MRARWSSTPSGWQGVSLEESLRYGRHIESILKRKFPDEIEDIWTRTGSAEVATDPMGLELSDIFITLKPRSEWKRAKTQEELVSAMAQVTKVLPGMRAVYTQPIEMRINEMVAGIRADLGIKLYGETWRRSKPRPRRSKRSSSPSPALPTRRPSK